MTNSRKRLRQLSSGNAKIVPPTATRVRIEAILDEKPKKKKKVTATKVDMVTKIGPSNEANGNYVNTMSMFSRVNTSKNRRIGENSIFKAKPSLLSDAPSYRQSKVPLRKTKPATMKAKLGDDCKHGPLLSEEEPRISAKGIASSASTEGALIPQSARPTKPFRAALTDFRATKSVLDKNTNSCDQERFERNEINPSFRVGLKLKSSDTRKGATLPRVPPPQIEQLSGTAMENADGNSHGFQDHDMGSLLSCQADAKFQTIASEKLQKVQKLQQASSLPKDRSMGNLLTSEPYLLSQKAGCETKSISLADVHGSSQRNSKVILKSGLKKGQITPNNDNFIRQNLRNSAGSCRGARNKRSRQKHRWHKKQHVMKENDENQVNETCAKSTTETNPIRKDSSTDNTYGVPTASRLTGLDPLDDFLDGAFHPRQAQKTATAGMGDSQQHDAPQCPRHQRPCKLLKVKKSTTGNKGRSFFACSMPRGEQCDYFQWADDTVQAARSALLKNTSYSAFLARQVAAHVERFKLLTVPELREEASRRKLNKAGKRQQLLTRLAIWVRDEVAKERCDNLKCVIGDTTSEDGISIELSEDDSNGDDSDQDTVSSEELEIVDDEDEVDSATSTDKYPSFRVDSNCAQRMNRELSPHRSPENSSDLEKATSKDEIRSNQLNSALRSIFGHESFRDGQEWAINRCLDHKKSLLVAPTGFGKSLCYALAATLMEGVCVVITPLISLIQDQLRSLPPSIPAATLSGSLSAAMTAAIIDDVVRKRIKILFISPERFASSSFRRLFRLKWNPETRVKERPFPAISLLCIDEAHCASHWAHNFRPCFLRFKSLLKLTSPNSVLAITATAGNQVIGDISNTLGINNTHTKYGGSHDCETNVDADGIRVLNSNRDNIDVSCYILANHEERLTKLIQLLKPTSSREDCNGCIYENSGSLSVGSVIVYVWRQRDAEVIAENLTVSGVSGGIVVYHAGMDAAARRKSQSKFMRGKARICVATVAFGLGIDKGDVVGVVHMYLSSSPEHYIQEIGRAGRDGRHAKAVALPLTEEVAVRHSLVHSDAICRSQVKRLVLMLRSMVRKSVANYSAGQIPQGQVHIALPLEEAVIGCDCKPETVETLLSLIEQEYEAALHVEGVIYDQATVVLKKRTLAKLADKEKVAASIMNCSTCLDPPIGDETHNGSNQEGKGGSFRFQRQFLAYSFGSYAFSVVRCACNLGPEAEPRHVFASLRRLQTENELELALDTSPSGRALHVRVLKDGIKMFCGSESDTNIEDVVDSLVDRLTTAVTSNAEKVLDMMYIMQEVANATASKSHDQTESISKSEALQRFQELTENYFDGQGLRKERLEQPLFLSNAFMVPDERDTRLDFISAIGDALTLSREQKAKCTSSIPLAIDDPVAQDYASLSITKFLHGIDTPRAPASAFRNHNLFGKFREVKFSELRTIVLNYLKSFSNSSSLG